MRYRWDDGGRKRSGFKREPAKDCACRAIAIASGKPYKEVRTLLLASAKRERRKADRSHPDWGVHRAVYEPVMRALGAVWHPLWGPRNPSWRTVTRLRTFGLLGNPPRRFVLSMRGHLTAVVRGVIRDTHHYGLARQVFGAYIFPEPRR